MAYLFEITTNKSVYPTAEALILSPFKEIWEKDKTVNKEYALEDFAYIEFMCSQKTSNPYKGAAPEKRHELIVKSIITRKNWKPSTLIKKGIKELEKFQTECSQSYSYYLSACNAAKKIQDFFNTVDISEKNFKTGNLLYKPGDITRALNDTEKVLANLENLKKKVEEELFENIKTKANKDVSPFAKII